MSRCGGDDPRPDAPEPAEPSSGPDGVGADAPTDAGGVGRAGAAAGGQERVAAIREYRATTGDEPMSTQPNVASSSVVLHLNVHSEAAAREAAHETHNYEREFLNYKPDVTLPFAYTHDDTFRVSPQEVSKSEDPESAGVAADTSVAIDPPVVANSAASSPTTAVEDDGTVYAARVTNVLRDFERKSDEGEWPLSTSVSCYWCCHPFTGPPLGLPVKTSPADGGYFVTGCFCSLPCASAFNLDSRDSHDTVCERHAMLSELSRILHGTPEVRAAPDWKALNMFGGYMTIEQFRAFSKEPSVLLVNVPPMRSLTTQLEEVNEGNVGAGYRFVPLDPVRIERGMQELSLKRAKPRFDYKNSLDHKMNVVIKTAAV
eukprot:jgi/Tetstr1/453926/TSEL_040845.t1